MKVYCHMRLPRFSKSRNNLLLNINFFEHYIWMLIKVFILPLRSNIGLVRGGGWNSGILDSVSQLEVGRRFSAQLQKNHFLKTPLSMFSVIICVLYLIAFTVNWKVYNSLIYDKHCEWKLKILFLLAEVSMRGRTPPTFTSLGNQNQNQIDL